MKTGPVIDCRRGGGGVRLSGQHGGPVFAGVRGMLECGRWCEVVLVRLDMRTAWLPGSRWDQRLLLAAGLVFVLHAFLYLTWFVDDAAISMTYARNLASGHGLVLYPGGERVEAYSNPLWVFLLAAFSVIGANLFATAKALGILFGFGAIQMVARLGVLLQSRAGCGALEAAGGVTDGTSSSHESGAAVPIGGMAALLTAAHTPFVAWTTSGLEGGLYVFLLLWAACRFLGEQVAPGGSRRPWSGLLFFLLSITRPEGILFFAAAVFVRTVWDWRDLVTKGRAVVWADWMFWVGLFAAPWLAYQAWHYAEFATLVTNTYYVKRPESSLARRFLSPDSRGWRNIVHWAGQYRLAWAVPVMVVGLAVRRSSLFDRDVRWLLVAGLSVAAFFFPLYADGDWMREFRFLVPAAPLGFLLLAGGLEVIGRTLPRGWHRSARRPVGPFDVALVVAVWLLLVPDFWSSLKFVGHPEVSVADVKQRADFFKSIRDTLGLEDPVVFLDPDLGATSFYSGMHVVDTWGLADVPFAVHRYEQSFVASYVFDELQPDFAHVFGYWNSRVKILQDPRWTRTFLALPAYRNRTGGKDGGNYINRRLIRARRSEYPRGASPLIVFQDGLELVHASIEPRAVVPGGEVRVTLFWRSTRRQTAEALFLTRIEPAGEPGAPSINLDHLPIHGWYPVSRWRQRVVYKEMFRAGVPRFLAGGAYSLSVQVVDPGSGAVRDVLPPAGRRRPMPVLSVGAEAAARIRKALMTRARQLLASGQPGDAYQVVERARRTGDRSGDESLDVLLESCRVAWRDQVLAGVRASFKESPLRAARLFRPAYWRWLDDVTVVDAGRTFGARAMARAGAQEARGDLAAAFESYLAAVWLDPRLSSARRRAEALRLRRDRPQLPPGAPDDARWVKTLVVGQGDKGGLAEVRDVFRPGEAVTCHVYWQEAVGAHVTRWVWFDKDGIKRFEQRQATAAKTRLSRAFVQIPPILGQWTVEVRVGRHAVGIRRFAVRR